MDCTMSTNVLPERRRGFALPQVAELTELHDNPTEGFSGTLRVAAGPGHEAQVMQQTRRCGAGQSERTMQLEAFGVQLAGALVSSARSFDVTELARVHCQRPYLAGGARHPCTLLQEL